MLLMSCQVVCKQKDKLHDEETVGGKIKGARVKEGKCGSLITAQKTR